MKNPHRVIILLLTLFVSLVFVPVAFAHPLGNFTINQYVGINISQEKILLDYVLDMAEIPAFQEIAVFDVNGNGLADASEAAGFHADKCMSLRPDLSLLLNKRPVHLTLTSSSVEFPAGVGGLHTLRLSCEFQAPLDATEDNPVISFANSAFPDRLGWNEIVVIAEGVSLQGDFETTSTSSRLTNYPQDLLTSPLDQRQVEFEITSIALPKQSGSSVPARNGNPLFLDRNDAFTRLILLDEITFPTLLFALVISFIWGAMHAMTPGHGKTIVGAYLVGSRGTIRHAVYLGLTTTIAHTLGVFALGLITLFAAQFIVPERLYPWMSLLSGLFVLGIGVNLFAARFKSSGLKGSVYKFSLRKLAPAGSAASWRLGAMTLRRFWPNTTVRHRTLRVDRLGATVHIEGIGSHQRGYVLDASHGASHSHDHRHKHTHPHTHESHSHDAHDHADHSHLPPGGDGSPVTWRSLLALGISGGLLPCPSALVVLLSAIALNRIGFGLILVLAFSLGLAGALTAIGMTFIYAGRLFERFPSHGRIIAILPVLSALFVSLIGAAISLKALAEMGIV